MVAAIPASHKELLEQPIAVTMATQMPDGMPQTTVLWFDWDGEHILISTTKGRRKTKNIQDDPRVSLMFIDPQNMYRYLEVRGTVEIEEEGAYELIDRLANVYTGADEYYGGVAPAEAKAKEERVILKIVPQHIVANG